MKRPGETVRTLRVAGFAVVLFALASAALAQPASEIGYTIALDNPEQHLVDVQITLPPGAAQRDLQLPVWNALYQVRDFAQYVNWVRAKDGAGKTLEVRAVDKSRWQILGADAGAV